MTGASRVTTQEAQSPSASVAADEPRAPGPKATDDGPRGDPPVPETQASPVHLAPHCPGVAQRLWWLPVLRSRGLHSMTLLSTSKVLAKSGIVQGLRDDSGGCQSWGRKACTRWHC